MREIKITPHVLSHAEGSAEVFFGKTRVICTASVDPVVPKWIRSPNTGWVTAEYGMLPRSTYTRMKRERTSSSGRSQEISRLVGRALRAGMDLKKLGERQIHVDCDVIEADGGSRTAAITGGFVAMALACQHLKKEVLIEEIPLKHYVCAVSAVLKNQKILLDPCYREDQSADADLNVVFDSTGHLIEIQGSAEKQNFSTKQLNHLLQISWQASQILLEKQAAVISSFFALH